MASTPTPAPSPTPTPSPTDLRSLTGSKSFEADAATVTVELRAGSADEAKATSAAQAKTSLTIAYDAVANAYTVSGGGRSTTFSPDERNSVAGNGRVTWVKDGPSEDLLLALIDHSAITHSDIRYVGAGYRQRLVVSGNTADLVFDTFAYGFPTPGAAMPRSGTGRFAVDMIGFGGRPGEDFYVLLGTGDVEADFVAGGFRTQGEMRVSNLTVDYWTGGSWSGEGTLSATQNSLTGSIQHSARSLIALGTLSGRLYGPDGSDIGLVFNTTDPVGGAFVGTLIGARDGVVGPDPFTVLQNGQERLYYGTQEIGALSYHRPSGKWEGSFPFIPEQRGKVTFAADRGVTLDTGPSGGSDPIPSFTEAHRIPGESNNRQTVYAKLQDGYDFRLVLSNPGPLNDEIALTYLSFGMLEAKISGDSSDYLLHDWFIYGVRPRIGMAGRTGAGRYEGIIKGSGFSYLDGSQYGVTGTMSASIDFDSRAVTGELRPVATPVGSAAPFTIPTLRFNTVMNSVSSFSGDFGIAGSGGEINGSLYGPTGGELGATWRYTTGSSAGFAQENFTGIAVARLQP